MPASARRLASLALVTLALTSATAASAASGSVELTAPFTADATSTSCEIAGPCLAQPAADKDTGEMDANVAAAGAYASPVVGSDASATATITASHQIPEGVESISYLVWVRVDPSAISAPPNGGHVTLSISADHSSGVSLDGATTTFTPFIGGIIVHDGDQLTCLGLQVRAEDGPLPAGTINVDVSLVSSVRGPNVAGAGGAAGTVTSGFTLQRILGTW